MKLDNFKLALEKMTNVTMDQFCNAFDPEYNSRGFKTVEGLVRSAKRANRVICKLCSWPNSSEGSDFWRGCFEALRGVTDEVVESWSNIRVGQKWKRRDGGIVEITGVDKVLAFPVKAQGRSYSRIGQLWTYKRSAGDLVFLVEDVPLAPGPVHLETHKLKANCRSILVPAETAPVCICASSGIAKWRGFDPNCTIPGHDLTSVNLYDTREREAREELAMRIEEANRVEFIKDMVKTLASSEYRRERILEELDNA